MFCLCFADIMSRVKFKRKEAKRQCFTILKMVTTVRIRYGDYKSIPMMKRSSTRQKKVTCKRDLIPK